MLSTNSIVDVSLDGEYLSAIKDPDQRFAAFMAALTSGHVNIASTAMYISKIGLSIAIRYALSRRAFAITPNGCEILLLYYPSHQPRLLPLLAKTMICYEFAANYMKMLYVNRTPRQTKPFMLFQVHSRLLLLGTINEHYRNALNHVEDKA
ncbi:hypothetical protein Pint_14446 [Pistacia integerrima]|uniref:Uncharacterized protein n=1 Tax=Pistacia integerrima TaxID=434235 RepID=A0ACC0Y7Q9_9ROSI|nr:hypothetical protein Pint_14446 [Pistacia integerrima]